MKLYEILLRRIGMWSDPPKPVEIAEENKVYNPIGCKIGGVAKIDSLDFREHRFTVKEIREYSIGRNRMVDYVLLARPIGKPDFLCRLRIVPDPDSRSTITHRALLMTVYDEFPFNEEFLGVVNDEENKFVIDNEDDPNNIIHDEFWRVNDVGESHIANVKVLADTDRDGKVSVYEVSREQVEFWDYSRETDLDGVEVEEFVFVEMNKGNDGQFKIWRGSEVNPEQIEVF